MADLTLKAHDTWPPVRFTLSDANGPVDLSTATTVKMILKGTANTGAVTITGTCVPDPDQTANKGKGSYTWATGDTDNPDTYNAEFEVTWGDGTIETFPNDGYKTVLIEEDLG